MCYACKTSSCRKVIGVIPYLPYSKQTKMRRRGNISLKLVAQMLTKAGFDHIITLDLHSKESIGFFDCAIDNLRASPFLIQYIQGKFILAIVQLYQLSPSPPKNLLAGNEILPANSLRHYYIFQTASLITEMP